MKRLLPGLWVIIVISLFVALFQLGHLPLLDPDEPVYAETPREMLLTHDWLSPRIYGVFWYDKPPLYYWLVAMSFSVFGMSEFAARLPSGLMAIATAVLVYQGGVKLFDRRTGLFAALILITSFEFFYMAKAAVTDMTLTFCFTAALLAFLLKRYLWLYLFAALATVTKGPIGLAFPGIIILLYLLAGKRWSYLREMKLPQGIIIYLAVAAPWYGAMAYLHGADFINTFIGLNNITRFTTPEHPEGVLWYYYIPVIIAGFFPWTAVLVQSVKASWQTYGQTYAHLLFLNIWAFFILLFFTISQTKLVSYILPMYPPLALIMGWYLNRLWDNRNQGKYTSWPVMATFLFSCAIAGMIWGGYAYPQIATGTTIGVILFGACLVGLWYNYLRRDVAKMIYVQVAAMMVFSALLVTLLVGPLAEEFSSRTISEQFLQHYDKKSPIYVTKFLHPGFTYYSREYGDEIKTADDLAAVFAEPKAYVVLRQRDFNSLSIDYKQQLILIAQSADKLLMFKQ